MRIIGLGIAFVIILGVAILASKIFEDKPVEQTAIVATPQPTAPAPVQTVDIVVAKQDITIGAKLDASMLDRQPWPANLVLPNFVTNDAAASVVGTVARSSFQAREPVIRSKLANPNDPSFMAAQLPAGMRAVTLKVDEITGIAGFVYPGDRIDVLVRQVPKKPGEAKDTNESNDKEERVVEVLIPNVRVLAVNQQADAGSTGGAIVAPRSISLEVTQEQAQRLFMAQRTASVTLALRSLKDNDVYDVIAPTLEHQMSSIYSGADAGQGIDEMFGEDEDKDTVRIVRGTDTK